MTTALKIGDSVITSVGSKTNTCVKIKTQSHAKDDTYALTFCLWKSETSMNNNEEPCVDIFKNNLTLPVTVLVDITGEYTTTKGLQALKAYFEDSNKEFGFSTVTEITQ